MTRKIFLEGDRNGNRPNPVAAILLCLIPVFTFMYLKRRHRIMTGAVSNDQSRNQPDQDGARPAAADDPIAKKALEDATKILQAEMKAVGEKQAELDAEKQQLVQDKAKLIEAQWNYDKKSRPNDPAINDPFPLEAYDKVKPRNPNPTPPAKGAMRPFANGRTQEGFIQRPKSVDFLGVKNQDHRNPIESMALMHGQNDKVNRPGIQIFPGDRYVTKDEKIKWKAKPQNLVEGSDQSPEPSDTFKQRTAEIQAHISPEHFAILQRAANIALAKTGSQDYEEAMAEIWHPDFGVYPEVARMPMKVALAIIEDGDVKGILDGVEEMRSQFKFCLDKRENVIGKSPKEFKQRYCLEGDPSREQLVVAWFFDSFRLVSFRKRMTVIKGAPIHMETKFGKKFLILEWLERFGVVLARQRLVSPRGFNFPGLCVRLHCLPISNPVKSFRLVVTLFLPGGPEKLNGKREPMFGWEERMRLAKEAWIGVWGTLIAETGSNDHGHEAFTSRELVFCPGFTLEGLKQAGGLPDQGNPHRPPDPTNPTRYEPVLNRSQPSRDLGTSFTFLITNMSEMIGVLQATTVSFFRHRQHSWSTSSLSDKSHDFASGTVHACLAILDPRNYYGEEELRKNLETYQSIRYITFGSTIPMTTDERGVPLEFPDLTSHRNLARIIMSYVPVSSGSIPSTTVLILSDKLGLKTLLQAKRRPQTQGGSLQLWVDIKADKVQQLADELSDELKKIGGNDRTVAENKEVLRQIYIQHTDLEREPIIGKMTKTSW